MNLERLRNELGGLLVRALVAESRVAELEDEKAKREAVDGVPVAKIERRKIERAEGA